jgi:hypothetical protein
VEVLIVEQFDHCGDKPDKSHGDRSESVASELGVDDSCGPTGSAFESNRRRVP